LNADASARLQPILTSLNGQYGILGSVLVARDGRVLGSSLPENVDTAMIGALSATLFCNNDVSIQRMNRGNLVQMTLLTDQGILHFFETKGCFLVVLSARGEKTDLAGLIGAVENQGNTLSGMLS
jgi:uncharacterized protein